MRGVAIASWLLALPVPALARVIDLDVVPGASRVMLVSTTLPVPDGCVQPGHALWLDDVEQHLVISCFGSDNLAVFIPEIPPPPPRRSRPHPHLATESSPPLLDRVDREPVF